MANHAPNHGPDGRARRVEPRADTRVPVTIRTMRETTHGLVLDMSPTGARLYMDGLIDSGNEVLLHWLGHEAFGVVAWSRRYECGVRFPRPLDQAVLNELAAALAGTPIADTEVTAEPEPSAVPEPEPVKAKPARQGPTFASLSPSTIVRGRRRAF